MTERETVIKRIAEKYGLGTPPWNWKFSGDPTKMLTEAYDAGCAAQAQKAPKAILAAMEWSAKYPLQGELSRPDARAAAEVYALCCEALTVSTGPQEKEP